MSTASHQIVIVGGGTAGLTVASQLVREDPALELAIIEPSDDHFYQPMWTLNGAGVDSKEKTRRKTTDLVPDGSTWIQDAATEIRPGEKRVRTRQNRDIEYELLVVAPGIQLNWDTIPGLRESVGRGGVCSNYAYEYVDYTWQCIREFNGGTALFTMPDTPVKCPGAPQKIAYLADDYFRRKGVRDDSELIYVAPTDDIFGVEPYASTLRDVVHRKDLDCRYQHHLVELRPDAREAVLEDISSGEKSVCSYEMIHVTPPQSAPDFIRESSLTDEDGWVDVDPHTLQHPEYPNIFSLGDASNAPTSKTGAAIRRQAPVVVGNLLDRIHGREPSHQYDGYAACPLVTGYGSVVLAEFDYEGTPRETFPVDQSEERLSMYWVKKYLLPNYYWHAMLPGRF